jgi:hypothetical protein
MVFVNDLSDSVRWILEILGKPGPIKFDSQIASHNDDLKKPKSMSEANFQALKDGEVMYIGEPGRRVTKEDCLKFLQELEAYAKQRLFDNGRSYIYEGVSAQKDGSYQTYWGS